MKKKLYSYLLMLKYLLILGSIFVTPPVLATCNIYSLELTDYNCNHKVFTDKTCPEALKKCQEDGHLDCSSAKQKIFYIPETTTYTTEGVCGSKSGSPRYFSGKSYNRMCGRSLGDATMRAIISANVDCVRHYWDTVPRGQKETETLAEKYGDCGCSNTGKAKAPLIYYYTGYRVDKIASICFVHYNEMILVVKDTTISTYNYNGFPVKGLYDYTENKIKPVFNTPIILQSVFTENKPTKVYYSNKSRFLMYYRADPYVDGFSTGIVHVSPINVANSSIDYGLREPFINPMTMTCFEGEVEQVANSQQVLFRIDNIILEKNSSGVLNSRRTGSHVFNQMN
jgi:hypothetical protein